MHRHIITFLIIFLCLPAIPTQAEPNQIQRNIERIQQLWSEGQIGLALTTVEEILTSASDDARLHKLRGDLLLLQRQNAAALTAYDRAIHLAPHGIEARWAKWSLLARMGDGAKAIQELEHLTEAEPTNPVLRYRLGNALRREDRLEEAIPVYWDSVALAPGQLRWHLTLARTMYDVLRNNDARVIVNHVLTEAAPGSSVHAGAQRLLAIVDGGTTDKGRRSKPFGATREGASRNREWALTRGHAWALMKKEQFQEAEPVLRQVMAIKPDDHRAHYDLGKTLMALNRYTEAIHAMKQSITLSPDGDIYPDAIFRIGQCLAQLSQWDEARKHFDRVLAIEHWRREPIYSMTFPHLHKVESARTEAIEHATRMNQLTTDTLVPPNPEEPDSSGVVTDANQLTPQHQLVSSPLSYRDATIGRDSFRAWFSHIIPAEAVERDDIQTGAHDFLPLNPRDTFHPDDPEITLVFGVLLPSYDAIQLTAEYVLEPGSMGSPQSPLGRDTVELTNNEQSGYFVLHAPEEGWPVGIYRVDLFMGDQVSAATHVDEVWFRIVEPQTP